MVRTEYSWLSDDEIIAYLHQKQDKTVLECELLQRFELALIRVEELEEEVEACSPDGFYTRRPGQSSS